jgi:RimJ/RimL family protein N-acetyltransferase
MPAGEAELLVHVRSEILVAQDLDHANLSPLILPLPGGDIVLRQERSTDAEFLAALFRSSALAELALMPADDAVKEALVRMQFNSQTATYRSQFPNARFDIIERNGNPIGRLVVDPGEQVGCIVDFALLPDSRGSGLGTAIMRATVQQFAHLRRRVQCKVLAGNEASLRMCLRVGFVPIGEAPPFLQLEWRPPGDDRHLSSGTAA